MRDLLRLFQITRHATRPAAIAASLLSAKSLCGLLEPLALMAALNALASGIAAAALLPAAALAALKLANAAIGIAARRYLSYAGQRFTLAARDRLYRHLQTLPPPAHAGDGRASRLWTLTGDLTTLEGVFSDVFVRFVALATAMIGAVAALLLIEPRLALGALGVAAGVVILVRHQHTVMVQQASATRDARAQLSREIETRLAAMEALQLARRETLDAVRVRAAGLDVARAELAFTAGQARTWGRAELLGAALQGGVVLGGGLLIDGGSLTVGGLLAAYLYVGQVFDASVQGGQMLGRLQSALVAAARVLGVLDEQPAVRGGPLRPPEEGAAALDVEHVMFAHAGNPPALDDVTFALRPGERVALMGPTGSGKTTLVRLLARFQDPNGGRIRLDGHDLRELDLEALRSGIVVLPQSPGLIRGTLAENICFSPGARGQSPVMAARLAALDDQLCDVLFERPVGDDGATLSGGQRQRVALARLFFEQPRLLVLDEPTTGLDDATADRVWAALDQHARGCTLLLITHDRRLANRLPRVLMLDQGRLVADGPPASVLTERPARQPSAVHPRSPQQPCVAV